MEGMAGQQVDEVERTFEVPAGTILPSLTGLTDGLVMGQPTEVELEATYFDTPDLALARRGVTLRRRTGGDDAGWHVKLPRSADTRAELRWPLGRSVSTVPEAVLAPVRAWVRDSTPVPVAVVRTRRLERTLIAGSGTVVALLCDDEVRAERLVGGSLEQAWREWEVELAAGGHELLDAVAGRLVDAGARACDSSSKLVRALADLAPSLAEAGSPSGRATVEQLLAAGLRDVADRMHLQDQRLRAGKEGAIHRLRIATRRGRSALRTFKPLLDRERADHLADELQWLGSELARARDAQVLRERLLGTLEEQPSELVMGRVAARIRADLDTAERSGRSDAAAALDSERYYRLLDELDTFVEAPPLTSATADRAVAALPQLLHRDAKRLRRAVAQVEAAEQADDRDAALHEARKKAKRLRYAAELAAPVLGKRAKRLGRRAKAVQQALGRHQDAVVARTYLRDQGARAHVEGENGFTYGRLHALQEGMASRAVDDFARAWDEMPSKSLRRWLAR